MNTTDDQLDLPQISEEGYDQQQPVTDFDAPNTGMSQFQQQASQAQAVIGSMPVPEEANDIDLIEKEWVLKAKQIVQHTYDDPYTQQAEISKMKADYMKKRYNKDVKIAEGS